MLIVSSMAMCLCSLVLCRREARAVFDRCSHAHTAPADLELTQPATFLPLGHRLYLLLAAFGFAAGLTFYFGIDFSYMNTTPISVMPLATLALVALLTRKVMRIDTLHVISFLLAVGAFLSIGFVRDKSMMISVGLFGSAEACFYVLLVILLTSLVNKNASNAIVVCAWGLGLYLFGWGCVAFGFNLLAHQFMDKVPLLVFPLAWAFVVFNTWCLRDFSIDGAVARVEPAYEVVVPSYPERADADRRTAMNSGDEAGPVGAAPGGEDLQVAGTSLFRESIDDLAEQAGLTRREREIFELLARGRNVRYLHEQMGLSRNTVKTHVAHIYAKCNVHSQQELIDLVERASQGDAV